MSRKTWILIASVAALLVVPATAYALLNDPSPPAAPANAVRDASVSIHVANEGDVDLRSCPDAVAKFILHVDDEQEGITGPMRDCGDRARGVESASTRDAPAQAGNADRLKVSVTNKGEKMDAILTIADKRTGEPAAVWVYTLGPRSIHNFTIGVSPGEYTVTLQNVLTAGSMTVRTGACSDTVVAPFETRADGLSRSMGVGQQRCEADDGSHLNVEVPLAD